MIYILPVLGEFSQLFQRVKKLFGTKKVRYKLAALLDVILIIAILMNAKQPAQRLVSPLVSSFHSFYSVTKSLPAETFAFVPDLAQNKFPYIDVEGLTYLSFFDVPITENGDLNYYSRGYNSFSSGAAYELFERARSHNTKIFLTLSALNEDSIRSLLDNPIAQQNLADQAIQEIINSNIDGVTIDFEFLQGGGKDYQEKFTNFVSFFANRIRGTLPQAQIAVAVPSSLIDNQYLYNIESLGQSSDKIFIIASNFIVPEVKDAKFVNPEFGYSAGEYWSTISKLFDNLTSRIPERKLVVERAWYGNGDNYPLYMPIGEAEAGIDREPSGVWLDQDTIERLAAGAPDKGKEAAKRNIPLIAKALDDEGILDSNVLAYALATVEHETDETFEPIGEIQGAINARRLGYEGGSNYFGRGFIQITHLRNYRKFGERIGMGDKLAKNPELASKPEIATKILAAFFKDNNVANLASRGNFVAARKPINPDYNGGSVARLAMKYSI